jgi:hypothetical protein
MTEKPKPTWLDDPDAPPSEEEKIASARLKDALEDPNLVNADAELARALALADAPRELTDAEHRAIIERAVATTKPRGRVIRVVFGVTTALALAAAAVLVVGTLNRSAEVTRAASVALAPRSPTVPPLAQARSTQELFDEPFAKPLSRGAASARIDRIAMARAGDLRENRFAMWGVR